MSVWTARPGLGELLITIQMRRTHEVEKETTWRKLEKSGGR